MQNHWWNEAIFYHYYPFGAFGALEENNSESNGTNRFEKLIEWIPYLVDLGITAIYLGPLFESSDHGYDTSDYFKVDSRLGSNNDLKECIAQLKKNNIKVIFDGVFNHVGRNFWAFDDVRKNLNASKYCGWFSGLNFNGNRSPYDDPFTYDGWEGHYNLVKLNLQNHEVRQHLFTAIEFWINEFNIDGIRLDVAYCLDREFLTGLVKFCKTKNPNFWLMGEIIHGDYRDLIESTKLDSITNYECYKGLYSSHVDSNYFEIAYSFNRLFGNDGLCKNYHLYNFVDNHDVSRVSSMLQNQEHLYPLYILLFTMPGIPSIYYGSEWGVEGSKTNGSDSALRPYLDFNDISSWMKHKELHETIKKLIRIKKEIKELSHGNYNQIHLNHKQFGFSRTLENNHTIILVNSDSETKNIEINIPQIHNGELHDLLSGEKYTIHDNKLSITLWTNWGRILRYVN